MADEKLKSLFEYDDYRAYLRDFFARAKTNNKRFSLRSFARLADFKSAAFMKFIMEGKRNLGLESVEKLARALKLNKEEAAFFRNLVQLNQASSSDQKVHFSREIIRSRTYKSLHPLKQSQFNYLSHWYYIAIREMVALPHFKEDADWISGQLKPRVSAGEVKTAIEELLKIGVLKRNEAGQLTQAQGNITTHDQVTSVLFAQVHKEMIARGLESIDAIPKQKRDISSVTFRISKEKFDKIRKMIETFRADIMKEAAGDHSPTDVYQVNFQLFPLAETDEGSS